jgi:hypothetical protein
MLEAKYLFILCHTYTDSLAPPSLVAGDQRESKRRRVLVFFRGGNVFFSSCKPKRIKEETRTGLL